MNGLSLDDYVAGVEACDRAVLGRAITLIESSRADHQSLAQQVLAALLPRTGGAHRVGLTGVPGAGKSTLIDALGTQLTSAGHQVAVLAIDPSSLVTGGSILGDKTRMADLSTDPRAFIRPSPSARTLGGVARKTRETMLLCEAAGFDVVIVETMGVGQSETVVAEMVDVFVLLTIAGAGDELQGIKRGVMELAEIIAVNKADGANTEAAALAANDLRQALHFMRPLHAGWRVPVLTVSALARTGLDELWDAVVRHRETLTEDGSLESRRRDQQLRWMWSMVEDRMMSDLRGHAAVRSLLPQIETAVREGRMPPTQAALRILAAARD
ncbi:methylmalonyl Co-A mutase-associated GTPase MeaB [bacterium]|nr:methylmalonyl Co-A mutase-associated GTPase MeaB [bacterium]MBU1675819.1 methylmalonyl Co-A mutase-associated GTPase MeaB [bacterium]